MADAGAAVQVLVLDLSAGAGLQVLVLDLSAGAGLQRDEAWLMLVRECRCWCWTCQLVLDCSVTRRG